MIVCSVLFSTAMIYAYWYVITGLLKQKKLGEMKNNFINNMSHELKTPLSTIRLAAATLRHEKVIGEPEKVKEFSEVITNENARMTEHVERILKSAQLDAGQLDLNLETVDLNKLLEKVVRTHGPQLEEKNGVIDVQVNEAILTVNADHDLLYSVFSNLIDNAIKYTAGVPQIVIEANAGQGGVQVAIQDNGIGMTAQEMKHLFTKFYRVESGDIHTNKGFGLGLNYIQQIIERHGGEIQVQSKKGAGSRFTVILPKS